MTREKMDQEVELLLNTVPYHFTIDYSHPMNIATEGFTNYIRTLCSKFKTRNQRSSSTDIRKFLLRLYAKCYNDMQNKVEDSLYENFIHDFWKAQPGQALEFIHSPGEIENIYHKSFNQLLKVGIQNNMNRLCPMIKK